MGSDIKMTSNPSYYIIKQTIKEEIAYDWELSSMSDLQPSTAIANQLPGH